MFGAQVFRGGNFHGFRFDLAYASRCGAIGGKYFVRVENVGKKFENARLYRLCLERL